MTSKRLHLILLAAVLLLLAALLGGTYGINSLLTQRSQKLTALKAQDLALQQEKISLATAKKAIAQYSALSQTTQAIVPQDKNQTQAILELVNLAKANGISLANITFPTSSLGATLAPTGATPVASTAPTAPTNNADSKTNSLSQLQPLKDIPGVYILPITLQSDQNSPVLYSGFIQFLSALEHNRRTAQVSSITIQPDPDDRTKLTFSLVLNEYIKP